MWADTDITPEDVRGRSRVDKLALTNLSLAIDVAKAIKHPWYRCQALTTAAQHSTSRNQKHRLLQNAFDAAQLQVEINRAVTVSAWPLRVLTSLDPDQAEARVRSLVSQANCEPHTLRRADALFALATAVQFQPALLILVMPSLSTALLHGHGWRIDRLIRFTVDLLGDMDSMLSRDLVAHHSEGAKKRQFVRKNGVRDSSSLG